MSLFFGGGQKTKPQFTGLSAQTSTSAVPVTIGFGKNRSSHNIIWQDDFQSHKKKEKAGKGGPSVTTYTYSASFILALGWGVVNDVTKVWKDQSKEDDYTTLGFTLFTGTTPQAPWGYLSSNHPDEALGYPGVSYLAVANYDLGAGNQLPQHSFEVEWPLYDTQVNGNGDADPAQIYEKFLTDESYGVGFNFTVFNQDSMFSGPDATTTGDNAYQTYCRAMGFGLSPVCASQEAARDYVERWARLTNTAITWNGYELKMIPYGAETVTANGVTYLPDFPVLYELNGDDFLGGKSDPITFSRVDPADGKNGLSITISNRDNEYNELPVSWRDQGLIDLYGFKKGDPLDAKEICEPLMAEIVVTLMGQRLAYVRNTFQFQLGPQYQLLEPMDVVQCYDPLFGTFLVQITDITETEDDVYEVTAEEYHDSITLPSLNSSQAVTNNGINTGATAGPVNPPIIFEPPRSLTKSQNDLPEVWAAVSGGNGTVEDPNWGGAYVWLSTDNVTFNQVGVVDAPARMGKLTATLATYGGANPDTGNTLAVSLDMSGGELEDATALDASAGFTLCYVDGELISFESADPTGTFDYDLETLYRGMNGSTIGSHASGSDFARLDDAIFKYPIPTAYIGETLYIKFQSYNLFGAGVQNLADCTTYTFTPTGASYGTGTGGVPSTPTGFAGSPGPAYARLTWTPGEDNDGITNYDIYRAPGLGQSFGSASLLDSVSSQNRSYTDSTAEVETDYTYFLVARNEVGDSDPTAGVDVTPMPVGVSALWQVFDTGTGSSQNVTIPHADPNEIGVLVFVNGIRYETSEYSISGTTLTLTTNASGDLIEVVGFTI